MPAPIPPLSGEAAARLEERRRARRRGRRGVIASFLVMVALPVLAAAIYYLFLASDQYVSEVKFAVRAVERNTATTPSTWSTARRTRWRATPTRSSSPTT